VVEEVSLFGKNRALVLAVLEVAVVVLTAIIDKARRRSRRAS
jgi:hypothetical protein